MPDLPRPTPEVDLFGDFGSDAVTYSIGKVSGQPNATTVFGAKFREIETVVNQERNRRAGAGGPASNRFTGLIENGDLNFLGNQASIAGSPPPNPGFYSTGSGGTPERPVKKYTTFGTAGAYYGDFFGVEKDALIYASDINAMIDKVTNAGKVCVCNCDYCTCNCDYCTCNCNYSCTCQCNYSDERLKTNITFVEQIDGLNVYSYKYVWNKLKSYYGVLAQELLGTKYETALIKDKDGYFMVDYSKLPVKMTEV